MFGLMLWLKLLLRLHGLSLLMPLHMFRAIMVGIEDLFGLFHPEQFYGSVISNGMGL